MSLETMEPTPTFDETANADAVEVFAALADDERVVVRVWGGDWCKDCRAVLPDLAAALDAAGFPEERIHHHEVDREKVGPGTEEYGVEYIPTIVVERDGQELARFVESEPVPAAHYLAEALREAGLVEQ